MTAEEHIWAAMAALHSEMGEDAAPLNDKLMQTLFGFRRWKREQPKRPLGLAVVLDRPRTAVVNQARDLRAGIVDGDGGDAA